MNFLSTYKYYFMGVVFVIYSATLWHISSTYTEAKYLGKQLNVAEATLQVTKENTITKNEIVKSMSETLAALKPQTTVINRTIQNEIYKDRVYIDCKSSPSVMREYQRKLDLQPK